LLSELTATFAYNYVFGLKKPKFNFKKRERFLSPFEGLPTEITPRLLELPEKEGFDHIIKKKKGRINNLAEQLVETQEKEKKVYKEIAINYLKEMDTYLDFAEFYNEKIYDSYLRLLKEAREIDREIRDEYIVISAKINSAEEKDPDDLKMQSLLEKRYEAHTKLLKSLEKWKLKPEDIESPEGDIKQLKRRNAATVFEMYQNQDSEDQIVKFLEIQLADIFHKLLKNKTED